MAFEHQQALLMYNLHDLSNGHSAGGSEEDNSSSASDTSSQSGQRSPTRHRNDKNPMMFGHGHKGLLSSSPFMFNQMNPINLPTNPPRRRSEKKPIPSEMKDGKYFERRQKNNQAAKKSRDLRKQREDEIAARANRLETEHAMLKAQLQTLKDESEALRQLLQMKHQMSEGQFPNLSGMGKFNNEIQNMSPFRFMV